MNTKYFLQSKRFWGFLVSLVGFGVWVYASHFGHGEEVMQYLIGFGQIMTAFGIPFTFYAGVKAEKPLGMSK